MSDQTSLQLVSKYRNVLMGFAALWILCFHLWMPVFEGVPKLQGMEAIFKRIGFCGVDIFFLLSGLGLTYSISKGSILQFYFKRIRRILLPFLVVAILRALFGGWSFSTLIKNVTGIHFYTKDIYTFLWFVPAIVTFYLLFPLYYRFFAKSRNQVIFTLTAIAIWLLATMLFRDIPRQDLFGFTNRIPVFLIGILLGYLMQHSQIYLNRQAYFLFAVMLVLGIYLAYLSNYMGISLIVPVSNCCIPNILMSLSIVMLLPKGLDMLLQSNITKLLGKLLQKVFIFYGSFSLESYCLQEWIGIPFSYSLIERYPAGLVNLLTLALITLLGFLLYFITNRCWKIADRLFSKQ